MKSVARSNAQLWVACLKEAGDLCRVHTVRDEAYALSRVEKEGDAFLGITLPSYEKDLLQALSLGRVSSNHFAGFRRRGGLPAFLSGFLRRIFDNSGTLLADPDVRAIQAVRQVCLLLSKVEQSASAKRERKALAAYVSTDSEVGEYSVDELFDAVVRKEILPFLADVEREILTDFAPRHSSGALATRESYNSRFGFTTWTERLQCVLPWWHDMGLTLRQQMSLDVNVLPRDEEVPVKVLLVPKTQKTPRVIACEPVWMQFVQQGILRAMTDVLLRPAHKRLFKALCWTDQEPNRALARVGSVDGSYATIDLSEASDRVSLSHVLALLKYTPHLRGAVLASRSEKAKLPDGSVIRLRKFASMGSALCFPFESLVFYTLIRVAQCRMGQSGYQAGSSTVRVYGDDLIVPRTDAHSVIGELEANGLKVNSSKSFTTGLFRESCGADWYSGLSVAVFKLRGVLPDDRRQYDLVRRSIEFHNRAYEAGWFAVASFVEAHLRSLLGRLHYQRPGGTAFALFSDTRSPDFRTNPSLHRREQRAWLFRETKPADPIDGEAALRKHFQPHGLPREKNHLLRDGRSRCVGMNTGWVAA